MALVSGCGFTPLHGPDATLNNVNVQEKLEGIQIAKLPHREGLILRNHLLDKLNPSGEPLSPEMILDLDLKLEKEITSLRRDGTSQRYNITATVDIYLSKAPNAIKNNIHKKQRLYEDAITRITSFSIGRSAQEPGYPGTVAQRDAIARALKLVADDVHLMLASYFKKWGDNKESLTFSNEPTHHIPLDNQSSHAH